MPLTHPRPPIVIAGQEFTNWREAGRHPIRSSLLCVTMDEEWGKAFLGQLGGYTPGILGNGTEVEFFISTVANVGRDEWEMTIIPEVRATGGRL